MKLANAKHIITDSLSCSANPALLCSFQKDSLALLFLVRSLGFNPALFWFHEELPQQAQRVIKEWDLTVFSYAPAVRYRVENSMISEYSIAGTRFPVIRDFEASGQRVGDATTPYFNWTYDTTLWGYKETDTHSLVTTVFEPEAELGSTRMVAPLYHFTDEEVLQMIEDFAIPYEPFSDDVLETDLPVVPLPTFRQRFSL